MTNQDPMNIFAQVQKMQADVQAAQDALADETVSATVGGGVVQATMSGDGELRAVEIDPSVVDPDDIETLQDLVVAAVIEASRMAKELQADRMGAATGGLDLDSMLGGLGGLLGGPDT